MLLPKVKQEKISFSLGKYKKGKEKKMNHASEIATVDSMTSLLLQNKTSLWESLSLPQADFLLDILNNPITV